MRAKNTTITFLDTPLEELDALRGVTAFSDGSYRLEVPLKSIALDPNDIRTHRSESKREALKTSIRKEGQKEDLLCVPASDSENPDIMWVALGGNTRTSIFRELDLETVRIKVKKQESEGDRHMAALTDNESGKVPMTLYDLAAAFYRAVNEFGSTVHELSAKTTRSQSQVEKLLKIHVSMHPDLKVKLDDPTPEEERITISEAMVICRFPTDDQPRAFEIAFEEASNSSSQRKLMLENALKAERAGKKKRRGGTGRILGDAPTARDVLEKAAPKSLKRKTVPKEQAILKVPQWEPAARAIGDSNSANFSKALGEMSEQQVITFLGKVRLIHGSLGHLITKAEEYCEGRGIST